jgi:hypothetical protein
LIFNRTFFFSYTQKLNWIGFSQSAFPAEPSEITVIDYLGYPWKLLMDFSHDGDVSCMFSGEWQAMCKARMLVEGSNVFPDWFVELNL